MLSNNSRVKGAMVYLLSEYRAVISMYCVGRKTSENTQVYKRFFIMTKKTTIIYSDQLDVAETECEGENILK